MSERILEMLRNSFTAHGLPAEREGKALSLSDGLVVEPRVFAREGVSGMFHVQVDFAIASPRLDGRELLDSFAGIGSSLESAEQNAFEKFLIGSFHVVAEALTTHECGPEQVEWEDWRGAAHGWRVCSGPLLTVSTREEAGIEGYPRFFGRLSELYSREVAAGAHWLRVFVGAFDGQLAGSEVLGPIAFDALFLSNGGGQAYPYREVLRTLELTETPRRLKAALIDYHGYLVHSTGGRAALDAIYGWLDRAELYPMFASEYAALVRAFGEQVVARGLDGSFHYFGGDALRTVRSPAIRPTSCAEARSPGARAAVYQ